MNEDYELGYEEPSQAEKWETAIRKVGVFCAVLLIVFGLGYLAMIYWPK